MPFTPAEAEKCPRCNKPVFAAEEKLAGGRKWHPLCLRCGLCNKALDSVTLAVHEKNPYCKQCYGRKFGPKGYGFGQGAGTLSMDTGKHLGNTATDMSNKPADALLGGQ